MHVVFVWMQRLQQFVAVATRQGPVEAVARARHVLAKRSPSEGLFRLDPRLNMLARFPSVPLTGHASADPFLTVHWVLPDFGSGGGGHMSLFRAMYWLEHFGHRNVVWIVNPSHNLSPEAARERCLEHYQPLRAEFRFLDDSFAAAAGDVIVASDSWSVWPVLAAAHFNARAYFVQDYEPLFTEAGTYSAIVESTYEMELVYFCAGPWLEKRLKQHGRAPIAYRQAVDHAVFNDAGLDRAARAGDAKPLRIAFYARQRTARRAVELGWLAFDLLAEQGHQFEVHAFGQEVDPGVTAFKLVNHGVLSAAALAELYRQSDIGVCFSASNYSLTGQEMAATGLPVVELDGDNTRTGYAEGSVVLSKPHPAAIAAEIGRLIDEPERRLAIGAKAKAAVAGLTWEKEMARIEAAMRQVSGRPLPMRLAPSSEMVSDDGTHA